MFGIHKAVLLMSLVGASAQEGMPNCLKNLWGKKAPQPVKNGVGVIKLVGTIDHKTAESLIKKTLAFTEDANIKGILLVINSGGGEMGSAELVFREIKALTTTKPVVTLAAGNCCSAAYGVAVGSNWIVAPSGADIGHIGIYRLFQLHKNVNMNRNGFKANVEYEIIHAGKYKLLGNANGRPMNNEERALVRAELDSAYKKFCAVIAEQRKLPLNQTSNWADGRLFNGDQALEKGLIDQVGGYSDAVKKLRELMKERGNPVDGKVTFIE